MRACRTTDDRLFAFVDGVELADYQDLDAHVATCDECQAFLAEVWEGELSHDLREPVIRRIRFDQFLSEMVGLGVNIVAAMGRATAEYTFGADARDDRSETEPGGDAGSDENEAGDVTP
jgi:hypothetical protein